MKKYNLAIEQLTMSQHENALETLNNLIESQSSKPTEAQLYNARGVTKALLGNLVSASEDFLTAMECHKTKYFFHSGYMSSSTFYSCHMPDTENYYAPTLNYAKIQEKLGNITLALEYYKKAGELSYSMPNEGVLVYNFLINGPKYYSDDLAFLPEHIKRYTCENQDNLDQHIEALEEQLKMHLLEKIMASLQDKTLDELDETYSFINQEDQTPSSKDKKRKEPESFYSSSSYPKPKRSKYFQDALSELTNTTGERSPDKTVAYIEPEEKTLQSSQISLFSKLGYPK